MSQFVRVELKKLGAVAFQVSTNFTKKEIAEVRAELLALCGRVFDEAVVEAKKKAKEYTTLEADGGNEA